MQIAHHSKKEKKTRAATPVIDISENRRGKERREIEKRHPSDFTFNNLQDNNTMWILKKVRYIKTIPVASLMNLKAYRSHYGMRRFLTCDILTIPVSCFSNSSVKIKLFLLLLNMSCWNENPESNQNRILSSQIRAVNMQLAVSVSDVGVKVWFSFLNSLLSFRIF